MVTWLKSKARNENLFYCSIPIILIFLALILFRPSFSTNDDVEVRSLLDGKRYGKPEYHIPYINSILTYLMSHLYTAWGTVYWYEIFLTLTSLMSCSILIYSFRASALKFEKTLYFPILFMISILMFKSINSMSYTNTAVLLTGTSVVLFYRYEYCDLSNSKKRFLYLAWVYLTLLLGYLSRPTLCLTVLAFLAPSLLLPIARKKLRGTKLTLLFVASASLWICNYIGSIAYRESNWQAWKRLMDSFIWPGDFNLLSDSIRNLTHSFLLVRLGVSESQIQLWNSANNIDPNLFSPRFIDATQHIPVIFDSDLILGHLSGFFHSYWYYLFLATLLVCHRWHLYFFYQGSMERSSTAKLPLFLMTFQYIYGLLFFIVLITYRKDVQHVSIGLIISFVSILIVIGYSNERFNPIVPLSKGFLSKLFPVLICTISLILMLNTIQNRPGVRNIFGGNFIASDFEKSELVATKYISSLPQCKDSEIRARKCTLFLHTNSSLPFAQTQNTNVRKLYLFWSAFSPKWEESILDSGGRDSLDLLCSNRGFLLNSEDSVAIVRNYIGEARDVLIDSIPVSSMADSKGLIGRGISLTVGSSVGKC